jgi:hypothetical protein
VLRLAAAVEQGCDHPLARAVTAAVADADALPGVADFDALPGRGVRGVVAEVRDDRVLAHAVLVGSPAFLAEHGVGLPAALAAARTAAEDAGRVAVAVAWDGTARGLLAVGDPVRPDAPAALDAARRAGIRPVVLTGAGPRVAAALAQRLGCPAGDVIAEPGPGTAREVVGRLRAEDGPVVAAVAEGGGLVDLPVPPGGAGGLVDLLLLARRVRRSRAVAAAAGPALAGAGAAAVAAGLLAPVLAPLVPLAGAALVGAGWAGVIGFRARHAVAPMRQTAPRGATCG